VRAAWIASRRHLRRAPFLIVLGLGWLAYGSATVQDPRYGTSRGLASITRYIPMDVLGWVWVGCGAVAVLAGLLGRRCPVSGPAGFSALAWPATLWGAAYTRAWADGGYPSAAGAAAAWTAFAIGIFLVSGMTDPPPRTGVIRR
jgi:hypothetical protein